MNKRVIKISIKLWISLQKQLCRTNTSIKAIVLRMLAWRPNKRKRHVSHFRSALSEQHGLIYCTSPHFMTRYISINIHTFFPMMVLALFLQNRPPAILPGNIDLNFAMWRVVFEEVRDRYEPPSRPAPEVRYQSFT